MRMRIVSFIFLLLAACLIPLAPTGDAPAQAVDVVNCTSIRVDTSHVEVKCTAAGIIVLDTTVNLPPGPTVQVTLPPVRQTITVSVPGPTQTQTVKVPVPGPTQSVTVSAPGPTHTATVKGPTATATVTATATQTTGQVDNGSGTVEPSPSAASDPVISLPAPTTVKGAALGTLAILILAGLILLALFSGYTLGYRESDSDNATFMKRILNKE